VREYHPQWLKKNFDLYKPTFHDDVVRRWDDRFKTNRRKVTQDPLFFDNKHDYINGGIKNLIEIMHEKVQYNIALIKMPIIFYNMAITDHFDPKIFKELENQYKLSDVKWLEARHCYGALYGYYKTNQGSRYGIDFWEALMEDRLELLHVQEVCGLL
jgi:hypothetical protein